MKNKKYAAFTLIELLVVIAIIGTLSTIMVVVFQGAQKNGRDRQRMSDLAQIAAALELYKSRYGYYPKEDAPACDSSMGASASYPCNLSCTSNCDWDATSDLRDLITSGILASIPKDPINKKVGSIQYLYYIEFDKGGSGQGVPSCPWTTTESCRYGMQTLLENGIKQNGSRGTCIYTIMGGAGLTDQGGGYGSGTDGYISFSPLDCVGSHTPDIWGTTPADCCKQ